MTTPDRYILAQNGKHLEGRGLGEDHSSWYREGTEDRRGRKHWGKWRKSGGWGGGTIDYHLADYERSFTRWGFDILERK